MYSINNDVSSKSNIKPQLKGGQIALVTFDGVEYKEVESKKDGKKYNLIVMKFSNDEGTFEDSTFEPKAGDDKRTTNDQGYLAVSVVEEILAKFRHLIAAVNPDLDKQIEAGTKNLGAKSWKDLATLMDKATTKGKGTKVLIKLMADKDGYGVFPRFFLGLSKAEKAYMRGNFIVAEGGSLAFTAKEEERNNSVITAKPTQMAQNKGLDDFGSDVDVTTDAPEGDGLDFDLEDL